MTRHAFAAALLTAAAACGGAEATPRAAQVIDSVVPRDTAIALFRRDLPQVDSLAGGARSRDELVTAFVRALETRDTAALDTLRLTRAEFGWLYYPTSPQGLPPYDLTPQLMWFMLDSGSERGRSRLLRERFGSPLDYVGYRCDTSGTHGGNTVWGPCTILRRTVRGDTIAERLFGQIVGRSGRYKFVSYANGLD